MKLLIGLVFSLLSVTSYASQAQTYKWKLNSCGPLEGSFYTDRDFDLSRFAFIEIDFRDEKDCTLKRLTQNGSRSTSQEYSYTQFPSVSWSFGCEINETATKFRLYISLRDGIHHYGKDEVIIEPTAETGVWSLKHSDTNNSRYPRNNWNYRQECRLTKI